MSTSISSSIPFTLTLCLPQFSLSASCLPLLLQFSFLITDMITWWSGVLMPWLSLESVSSWTFLISGRPLISPNISNILKSQAQNKMSTKPWKIWKLMKKMVITWIYKWWKNNKMSTTLMPLKRLVPPKSTQIPKVC